MIPVFSFPETLLFKYSQIVYDRNKSPYRSAPPNARNSLQFESRLEEGNL